MQRYEPRTQQRAANQLVQLLNVDLSGDMEDKTLSWERMTHTYEEQTGKIFAEDLRVGVWLSNAPESALKTHMIMRTDLVRWADFRAEMISCTRTLKASSGLRRRWTSGPLSKARRAMARARKVMARANSDPLMLPRARSAERHHALDPNQRGKK